jgi:hypothetical protein
MHRAHWQLFFEPVDLVQEQNDTGLDKPPRVANAVEQCKSFLHTIHGLVLEKQLVVLGDGYQEKDCGHILEAMYPFLPLRSLSSNVKHAVGEILDDEGGFCNASGLDTRSEHILVVGYVVMSSDSLDRIEVARQTCQSCRFIAARDIEAASQTISKAKKRKTYYRAESLS